MRLLISLTIIISFLSIQRTGASSEGESTDHGDRKHVHKRNVGVQLPTILQNRPVHQNTPSISNNAFWPDFAPTTPPPDEVDCQIEIEVTELVGGRCVRLGGFTRMAVCQSGAHLDLSGNNCAQILAEREQDQSNSVRQAIMQQMQSGVNKRSVIDNHNALNENENIDSHENK